MGLVEVWTGFLDGVDFVHNKSGVNPILGVVKFIFAQSRFASRESVWSLVLFGQYMDKLEVKQQACGNPSVDGGIGLNVRVAEHTFDVACIDFYDEVGGANEVEAGGAEGAEETIKF